MFPGANGLPDTSTVREFSTEVGGIVDMEMGPGGDLYYVDITDGTIHRIRYTGARTAHRPQWRTPIRTSGAPPLAVQFHGDMSSDPDGDALTYAWDLDGDGAFDDSTVPNPTRTYTAAGTVTVRLRVTDTHTATGDRDRDHHRRERGPGRARTDDHLTDRDDDMVRRSAG